MKFDKLKIINDILLKLKNIEYSISELEYDNIFEDEIEILSLLSHDVKYIEEVSEKYKNILYNK